MTHAAAAPRRRRQPLPLRLFAGAVLLALLLPWPMRALPASTGTLGWALDLVAHWQPVHAALWLVAVALLGARDRRWWLALPLALLPLCSASPALPPAPLPPAPPSSSRKPATPTLAIASANVRAGNPDPAPLAAWLRAQPADVVVLVELTPGYADRSQDALADVYPYRFLAPLDSPFGIGLLSRRPLADSVRRESADGIPTLAATLDTVQGPVRVIAAHPMPPLAPHWHDARDRLLRDIADRARAIPTVVAGDLNATPWSTALTRVAPALRRACGLAPTWPSGHVGIPIDHVLAGPRWRRIDCVRGPDIGSDHRPIRATLALDSDAHRAAGD